MSTKEAQKNASRAYRKRQKAAGSKQIGFLLSPDALSALERLAKVHGSKAAAVNAALISAAKVEEERSAAYYAIYGNTLTAEHVPIQRLDVDAEHRLAGPQQAETLVQSSKIVDKIGPVTDAKSGLRITHIQVGPAESRPGSRLKGKK